MPHSRLENLRPASERWPHVSSDFYRTEQWGDIEIGYTIVPPMDCTQAYAGGGLPGGVCPCPHYGYVFEGRIRARYPDSDWPDEVVEAGEAFFIPSGHVLIYEEESRVLELNPAHALKMCMDAMQKHHDRLAEAQQGGKA